MTEPPIDSFIRFFRNQWKWIAGILALSFSIYFISKLSIKDIQSQIPTIIVSLLALAVSAYNLWWNTLRKKRELYLVMIKSYFPFDVPYFALVNNSNCDLLISKVVCGLIHEDGNAVASPAQEVKFNGQNTNTVIESGKFFECSVTFQHNIGIHAVHGGKKIGTEENPLFSKNLIMDISWITPDGETLSSRIAILNFAFRPDGYMASRKSIIESVELFSWNKKHRHKRNHNGL
jgi:hypothetical protein